MLTLIPHWYKITDQAPYLPYAVSKREKPAEQLAAGSWEAIHG